MRCQSNLYEPKTQSLFCTSSALSSTYGVLTCFSHALALHERRYNYQPQYHRQKMRNHRGRSETKIVRCWFVGDHATVGGRFEFSDLTVNALANPPFRWIAWAVLSPIIAASPPILLLGSQQNIKVHSSLDYLHWRLVQLLPGQSCYGKARSIGNVDILYPAITAKVGSDAGYGTMVG